MWELEDQGQIRQGKRKTTQSGERKREREREKERKTKLTKREERVRERKRKRERKTKRCTVDVISYKEVKMNSCCSLT